MKLRKSKEIIYNPYKNLSRFCKFDGKELLNNKREILSEKFDEDTGTKLVRARYGKYCPDWQTNRQVHTEVYDIIYEYEDGTPADSWNNWWV